MPRITKYAYRRRLPHLQRDNKPVFVTFRTHGRTEINLQGPVWQEESFDHVLRSAESLENKIEYIALNPVTERLVERPADYEWLWIEGP